MSLFRVAGLVGVLMIIILSLLPGGFVPESGIPDRLDHLIAYAGTGAALAVGWRSISQRLLIVVGLLMAGILLELGQLWMPGRSCDPLDAISSALGGALGVLVVVAFGAMTGARRT